jgi:RNA recognition motif-containing protein
VDAHVITDRVTGQSKGFGFVEMSSEDEARSAIGALNGTTLGERTLKLDEAGERPQRADGHNDTSRNRGGSRSGRW